MVSVSCEWIGSSLGATCDRSTYLCVCAPRMALFGRYQADMCVCGSVYECVLGHVRQPEYRWQMGTINQDHVDMPGPCRWSWLICPLPLHVHALLEWQMGSTHRAGYLGWIRHLSLWRTYPHLRIPSGGCISYALSAIFEEGCCPVGLCKDRPTATREQCACQTAGHF